MILVGSQRGGAGNLARHLLNDRDNDHVTVLELRGFTARDLHGAFEEAHAISLGTNCKQFLFSLSLNPPKDGDASPDDLTKAADQAEEKLGLTGQPRAVVIHEKNGRRHAHAVWSRIDAQEMKAINLSHFKNKLNGLSKDLYLEHGWTLPDGYRENAWKNPLNFTLAEWQQAKRVDLDPREIKQVFQQAWAQSDNLQSFKAALDSHGYFLARGDRRGFVALDVQGEVYSVARMTGVKTKDVTARLGSPDGLLGVEETQARTQTRMTDALREHLQTSRQAQREALRPVEDQRRQLVQQHKDERARLERSLEGRWREEAKARSERLRKGVMGFWDSLTGRAAQVKSQNVQEAYAALQRDRAARETLHQGQSQDLASVNQDYLALKSQQRQERMQIAAHIGRTLYPNRERGRESWQQHQKNQQHHGPRLRR